MPPGGQAALTSGDWGDQHGAECKFRCHLLLKPRVAQEGIDLVGSLPYLAINPPGPLGAAYILLDLLSMEINEAQPMNARQTTRNNTESDRPMEAAAIRQLPQIRYRVFLPPTPLGSPSPRSFSQEQRDHLPLINVNKNLSNNYLNYKVKL